ncbi:tetratricopeptide repeat protein [Saccharicrinis sp. FJH62]|uniref:tetratricopeptide repeat protein n=1 Tax=Saccharicrinis sp. FJH62 TaxID=3344657 RepID=UPI0035D40028
MEEKKIYELHKKAEAFLKERLLKDTFDIIGQMLEELQTVDLKDRLEQYQTTYKFMLKYTVAGVKDPERDTIYHDLITSAFHLLDEVTQQMLTKNSTALPFTIKRSFPAPKAELVRDRIESVQRYCDKLELSALVETASDDSVEGDRFLEDLQFFFNYFWTTDFYSEHITQHFKEFVEMGNGPVYSKSLMISALTLSSMRCFDPEKLKLLFDYSVHTNDEIRQRAIFGALIVLYLYDGRLQFFPEINHRLELLSEDKRFVKSVEKIVIQLIRSKETEKLTKKMQEEILPEMVKMNPYIMDKLNLDNLLKDDMTEDKNPDWQHMFDDVPGLTNKLEEFSELQMEGADVFMSTFAMLKSFPFFKRLINWFIPFSVQHPDLVRSAGDDLKSDFIIALKDTRFLCNSDKYSFVLSVQQVPSSYKEMMSKALNAELGQFDENDKDESVINPDLNAEKVSNQYIQDLYRFVKLHPQKRDFGDLFNWRLDFHNKKFFEKIIEDKKRWRNIGEYYFAKNYFVEALEVFEILLEDDPENVEILQKAGYSMQLAGDYQGALKFYTKADLIRSQELWTIKKIAYCYRQLNMPDKALEYYRQAEVIDDENLSVQLSVGHCLLDQKKFDEALKYYFRVEYLDTKNTKVWKPIAWCSFVTGKLDQATKYYQKIIDNKPDMHDYMNLGHVKWVAKDRQGALNMYKQSVNLFRGDMEKFIKVFNVDKTLLVEKGVDQNEIPIMLDRLRYDLDQI